MTRPLDKVIGYGSIKQELYRIVDLINNPFKYNKLGVHTIKGILFRGNPGIGKTLMAEALMEELAPETETETSMAEPIGGIAHERRFVLKKNCHNKEFIHQVVDVFEKARTNARTYVPSIVFMDDIDKFEDGNDSEIYATIQSCIDDCRDKEVIVLATANDTFDMPDSLLRAGRFDKIYDMTFPVGNDAKRIFHHYLNTVETAGEIDAEEIARCLEGYSCAALKNMVYEAAILAGYSSKEQIDQDDLRAACLRLYFGAPETLEDIPDEELRKTAIHEAGHTVVSEVLMPGSVNFVSIEATNRCTVGITARRRLDISGREENYQDKVNEIMISLAGKAAMEIMIGEIDIGTNDDMSKVFDSIRNLLDAFTSYNFHFWTNGIETSQRRYDNLDIAIETEVSRYYMKVKNILTVNRNKLEAVTEALLQKKTLFYREIESICL